MKQAAVAECLTLIDRVLETAARLQASSLSPEQRAELETLLQAGQQVRALLADEMPPLVALEDLAQDRRDLGADRMNGLLALFRQSSGADLDRLCAQISAGDLAQVGATAHRMAGAAASLHLRPLFTRCGDIESAARRGDRAAVALLAADLVPLWHRSVEALTSALS